MRIGLPKDSTPGEPRTALVPALVAPLAKRHIDVLVEPGAGAAAGYADAEYKAAGAQLAPDRAGLFQSAELLLTLHPLDGASLALLREGQALVGMLDPFGASASVAALAKRGVSAWSLELLPRITRAQSMDVLTSMANLAGYRAALLAAASCPRLFPMMMTAAGTIPAARVLVLGVGVAGLQAIATSRRLGAVVEASDIRPDVKEQIQSLGGKYVESTALDEALTRADAVITTAQVLGKRAPLLLSRSMVERMRPGAVIIDLAAEQGGNCELTRAGETVRHAGVAIQGPVNLPATMAPQASQLLAKNFSNFLFELVDSEGKLAISLENELVRETLVAHQGELIHPKLRELLGQTPRPGMTAT